ncbi:MULTISPECIES: hypothetical protein [Bradyrhizobium]|uniref:hypothetical protein n=1 Tax=Bradyrhizobium TaxID=374 RepID=UPI003221AB07
MKQDHLAAFQTEDHSRNSVAVEITPDLPQSASQAKRNAGVLSANRIRLSEYPSRQFDDLPESIPISTREQDFDLSS